MGVESLHPSMRCGLTECVFYDDIPDLYDLTSRNRIRIVLARNRQTGLSSSVAYIDGANSDNTAWP